MIAEMALEESEEEAEEEKGRRCCAGVARELAQRNTYCAADYLTAFRYAQKTVAAALFMFFATLFSTVALGALVEKKTASRIGLTEYLSMNAAAGVLHSLFAAQPLLVLRPTGPISAITCKLADLSDRLALDFHECLAATGLCVGAMMGAVAALELSRHIARLTPFTHDIFACFVCSIYVHDGVSDVLGGFQDATLPLFGASLFSLHLALLTLGASLWLSGAVGWRVLPRALRSFLSDYSVTLAVVLTTLASYHWRAADVRRIALPDEFGPTCFRHVTLHPPPGGVSCFHAHAQVSSDSMPIDADVQRRPWLIPFPPLDPYLWAVAFASAVPITFFFFMDQNISSLLCQLPEMGLARGHYLHSSFLAMAIFNAVGPMFGCPFVTGSLPHSPQFVRALSFRRPTNSERVELVVAESRVAPLLMYAMIALPLLVPSLLETIPESAIDGILAYVGYEGIITTGLWQRVKLLFTPSDEFPARLGEMSPTRVHLYTLLQLSLLGLCWIINLSPFGLCVAFLIVALVPLRECVLPRLFAPDELAALDKDLASGTSESAKLVEREVSYAAVGG
ncbi:hypothetical protein AB1Y20_016418 [Prymnesium parvum]|uniref:Bicarbonate transporter-like transmembrane domain-containing protein n=1 Tax=Prymnesium parvum TaxID=97485 RepID=A0AB34IFT7_PRYPA